MENQRIRLTKSMLKHALEALLTEKSIDRITVSELCAAAQINRTTFYKYYGEPQDVLAEIESDFFRELERYFTTKDAGSADDLTEVIRFLNVDKPRWKLLINSVGDQAFTEKLFSLPALGSLFHKRAQGRYGNREEEYINVFIYHGGYAVLRAWLNEESPQAPEQVARLLVWLTGRLLG